MGGAIVGFLYNQEGEKKKKAGRENLHETPPYVQAQPGNQALGGAALGP